MKKQTLKVMVAVLTALVFLTSCDEKDEAAVESAAEKVTSVGAKEVTPQEASQLIASKDDIVVVDLRTPEEFAEGHIEGAINIDFLAGDVEEGLKKLDPSLPTIFHCRSGGRSGQAQPAIEALPFQELYHLSAGTNGWSEAGLPMVQP